PLSLIHLGNGNWSGTWQPRNASTVGVTVSLTAQQPQLGLSGTAQLTIGLQANQPLPVLSGGPQSAVALAEGPLAPGDLILILGSSLADGQANSSTAPVQQLAGASVVIGGRLSSLLYADDRRLIGVVPFGLPVNTRQQLVVQHGISLGLPIPVIVA